MCCAMMFVAGRQNDVFANAKMMQPPTAAMAMQGNAPSVRLHAPAGRTSLVSEKPHHSAARQTSCRKKAPAQWAGAFAVHHSYNFPHCLPVKKRRVVVARNTLPARSTVEGNSGWEGLQG